MFDRDCFEIAGLTFTRVRLHATHAMSAGFSNTLRLLRTVSLVPDKALEASVKDPGRSEALAGRIGRNGSMFDIECRFFSCRETQYLTTTIRMTSLKRSRSIVVC